MQTIIFFSSESNVNILWNYEDIFYTKTLSTLTSAQQVLQYTNVI